MARMEPLRPGEEEFPSAAPGSNPKVTKRGGFYGRPALSQPPVGASESDEDAWAHRVLHQEARAQRMKEEAVYKAARSGSKVEHDDPVLQQVQEFGEEMHSADRRHDFLIGMGALGRAMSTLGHFGGKGGNRLAKAARYYQG